MSDFVEGNACEVIFQDKLAAGLGQRLGVPYLRAQQEYVKITLGEEEISLLQSSLGLMAISGVVWDAGLLLVDFLADLVNRNECKTSQESQGRELDHLSQEWLQGDMIVLDLGCGTGVCGYCAYHLGIAKEVVFSDIKRPTILEENLKILDDDHTPGSKSIQFVSYDWNDYNCIPRQLLLDDVDHSKHDSELDKLKYTEYSDSIQDIDGGIDGAREGEKEAPIIDNIDIETDVLGVIASQDTSVQDTGQDMSQLSQDSSNADTFPVIEQGVSKNNARQDASLPSQDSSNADTSPVVKVCSNKSSWDIVLCSDVLYESSAHRPLMETLKRLSFKTLLLSYKRRHDDAEQAFLRELSSWCDIRCVDINSIALKNVTLSQCMGLYLLVVTKKP